MKASKLTGLSVAILFLVAGLLEGPVAAQTTAAEQLSLSFKDVVKKVRPAVVYIEIEQGERPAGSGSGVIIDGEQGYVLTANHVVEEAERVKIRLGDGREFTSTDMRNDPTIDIAVLKIDGEDLPSASLGSSEELEVGDWVLAIGSPFGRVLENSVSAGIVSARGRRTGILSARAGIEDFIQTDAVINKGNSGGPLVNLKGEIVGINSNIISATGMYAGLGFAVPSRLIKPSVEQLIEKGRVARGWMGITITSIKDLQEEGLENVADFLQERGGAYVVNVAADKPAEKAGIKKGDVIVAIAGEQIYTSEELVEIVSAKQPGEVVECRLWRGAAEPEELAVEVELGERPTELSLEELYSLRGLERPQRPGRSQEERETDKLGLVVSDYTGTVVGLRGFEKLNAVQVGYVKPDSLAAQYGLGRGDIITKIDGEKVESVSEYTEAVEDADLQEGVRLTLLGMFGEYEVIIKSGVD